ncbi:MAG: hypothetical protein WAW96_09245 [Alphaproteobacteria bacterium]
MRAELISATADDKTPPIRLGVARLTKLAYAGNDLTPIWTELRERVMRDPTDAGALMDLSVIAQLTGNAPFGEFCQQQALAARRLYRLAQPGPAKLRVLALCAAVDIGGNTPLDFLIQDSDVDLATLYVVPGADTPADEPFWDHDIAFVAVPDSDKTRPTLAAISKMLEAWPRPILNRPDRVPLLERDRFFKLLNSAPGIAIPPTLRVERAQLTAVAQSGALPDELEHGAFPLIIRPVGSQAGRGLEKIDDAAALAGYLARLEDEAFFLSPFVDYSGTDGLYRKYRIAFIDGRPFPCHMAVGADWSLWYLNAGMEADAAKRAEEEQFLLAFDQGFGARHSEALAEIAHRVRLDYFGIDCAETKDGKLLLFEGDIAMIVHDMDSPEIFPYKVPAMRRLFDAFIQMLHERAKPTEIAAA